MKKISFNFYTLLVMLVVVTGVNQGKAQPKIALKDAGMLVEKTVLITDRETYSVDENILFSAFNVSSAQLRNSQWSNVLYVELVSPDGEAFTQRKYAYNQDGSTGSLKIPVNLLTGNYYLRAYTRWMRDYSPYNYFYKMVTIINPFRPELLEPSGNKGIHANDNQTPLVNTSGLVIKTDKESYKQREQVNLDISAIEQEGPTDQITVSVVPKGTEIPLTPTISGLQKLSFSPGFIPETRGLSISGKVVNQADSLPLPYTLVGLTIFKENPENRNVLSNDKGQFFFDLASLKGEYEIFISAKSNGQQMPLILVDNDFSTQTIELPYIPVDLSGESKKRYQTLIFNSQIQELYKQQTLEEELKSFSSDSSFYGIADFVLPLKVYIDMPTIKDYISELMPQVGIRHEGKRTVLKVLGPYSDLGVYEPMVLVDMVPVFDIDRVLKIPPDKIERVEVVTKPYVRGDIVYGGIISFFSKKGDLAGIDLPSAGRFITYSMLNSNKSQVAANPTSLRIPDIQNCLYWNPDLKLKGTAPAKVSFNTGDCAGDYVIVVRGLDKENNIKVWSREIRVN